MKNKKHLKILAVLVAVLFSLSIIGGIVFACCERKNKTVSAYADTVTAIPFQEAVVLYFRPIYKTYDNIVLPVGNGQYTVSEEYPINLEYNGSVYPVESIVYIPEVPVFRFDLGSNSDNLSYFGFQFFSNKIELFKENLDTIITDGFSIGFGFSSYKYYSGAVHMWLLYLSLLSQMTTPNIIYQEYQKGHQDGYSEGLDEGYSNGVEAGYNSGYDKGEEAGYKEGYNNGVSYGQTLSFTNPISLFLAPVNQFLSVKLFGVVSLGTCFSVVLFVGVALIFIKMFAGG